ncbi:PH domain-containing protein [Patescibacteria group bacterium]|nr:PH domain-containing protein [Patescibacteria group bacterium]MCL5410219.1 PH domain-containing protein [Patescibacteria group bacterium]
MAKLHYHEAISEKDKQVFARFLAEDEELILATGFGKTYLRSRFIVALGWPGFVFIAFGLGLSYLLQFNPAYGLLGGLIIAAVAALLRTIHLYHANRYLLTTRRVIIKKGVFAVQVTSALYDKITHIEVDQSFVDKVFYHHGTIIVNTAGMNKGEITITFIDYPIEFKNLLERLINREREQYGFHSGPVLTVEGEVVED